MTVKELIEKLQALPQESLVVVSKDAEGNGYDTLHQIEEGFFRKEGGWDGPEFVYKQDPEGDAENCPPAICLWP